MWQPFRLACLLVSLALTACGGEPPRQPAQQPSGAAAPPAAKPASPAARPAPMPRELGAALQVIRGGRFEAGRRMAQAYLAANPTDGRGHFVVGYAFHVQGNHGPAVPHFEKALAASPEFSATHHFFGECLFLLGELDAARAQHEAHAAADPREPDARYGIGLVDLEESRLDAAERRFLEAIGLYEELKKTNRRSYDGRRAGLARCHARLADIHFARDDYEAARDALVEATTISPGTISALYALSGVYRRLGRDELADETLERFEAAKAEILRRRGEGE